jgi:cell division septum initiation protein DivIVA
MSLPPEEARRRGLRVRDAGYSESAVEALLDDLVTSYDAVWREREALHARVTKIRQLVRAFADVDAPPSDGGVQRAEAMAESVRLGEMKAERIVDAARRQAQEISRAAEVERRRLEIRVDWLRTLEAQLQTNYRAFLLAALNVLEDPPLALEQDGGDPIEGSRSRRT